MMPGMLFIVATPIGNLDDITLRALEVLKSVDLIAAEDTRHSGNLLRHFEIRKPLVSYHEHNEAMRSQELAERLAAGENVALISFRVSQKTALSRAVFNAFGVAFIDATYNLFRTCATWRRRSGARRFGPSRFFSA